MPDWGARKGLEGCRPEGAGRPGALRRGRSEAEPRKARFFAAQPQKMRQMTEKKYIHLPGLRALYLFPLLLYKFKSGGAVSEPGGF
jgi:hypothetical protein